MKKILSAIISSPSKGRLGGVLFALLTTTALWAYDFQSGDLYYNITSNSEPYTVAVSDAVSSITTATIPETVTYNGTTYSVTSIGKGAFYGCRSLTSVTIPNSVTSIGDRAFCGCTSLTSLTIPNSVTSIGSDAFYGCSALTSIAIPNSVTSIEDEAFCNCSSLTSVTIPNSVTSIGKGAFYGCRSLTSVTIPNSVTSIGDRAFYGCSSLTSLTIPEGVTSIRDEAFRGCSSLTSITIPNSVTNIGNGAFEYCSSLTSITIPNSVTSIREYAFYYCSSLTSITIPNGVTSIGNSTFSGCSSLTSITIPNSVTSIGWSAFVGCSSLTSITIPNSVESIGWYAFSDCSALTSITIPNSVTSIEEGAFYGCSALTSITIPGSVTSIGNSAFNRCSSLTSITIPEAVTSIGNEAFSSCSSLTSITCEAITPPIVEESAFAEVSTSIPVYVPCGTVSVYNAAKYWSAFSNIQEPLAEYSITVSVNDSIMGSANVDKNSICGNQISATPNFGYHFVQWSDGSTENPHTLTLTQDTILTAEFAQIISGRCGDNLYWSYNESDQSISITGSGEMYNYTSETQPWWLFKEEIKMVTTSNTATSIGESAFAGAIRLADVYLGSNIETIAENAFAECNRLYHIYCYPTYPPFAKQSSFANYNIYLHVPCEYKEEYDLDVVFGNFKYIECLGAETDNTSTDTVIINASSTHVTITWPTEENANTYTIVIKNGDIVFCTLTFNADGQLLNIAFAPGRDGNHPAQYAEQAGNGYRFTVTGLEEATHYAYNIDVRDATNQTINSYSGEFTTLSNVPSSVDNTPAPMINCTKTIHNGQLLILRDGKTYNVMGAEIQ